MLYFQSKENTDRVDYDIALIRIDYPIAENSACAAWSTAVLKGHCFVSRLDCLHLKSNYAKCFVCRLDYLHLKINHAKFQVNPIRNG